MDFNIIGFTKDLRTDTHIMYAQITIPKYLELIGDNFQDFDIQRKRERGNKNTERMRKDIKAGAVLPPITLAVKPDLLRDEGSYEEFATAIESQDKQRLQEKLDKTDQLFILDGLQRSFILRDLQEEETFNPMQRLLVEIWFERYFHNLIYRFVVLNAGQKKMSFRHQLDILFHGLKNNLEKEFEGLTLITERGEGRRTNAKQYQMRFVATSYHCFLIKNYEIAKDNIIAEQMQEDKILLSDDSDMSQEFMDFKDYFNLYMKLDKLYFVNQAENTTTKHFLADEGTMNAFFACVASYGNKTPNKQTRVKQALNSLIDNPVGDFLAVEKYNELKNGISSAKKNLGLAYKQLLFYGFREFFIESGEKNLESCWKDAYEILYPNN
jgi:hypothetical protein